MSQAIASLPVSSLIGDELITVTPETTIDAVARLLQDAGISIVAVGEPTAVEGVVSERDVVHVVAPGDDPRTVTAGDLPSPELVWCPTDSPVPAVDPALSHRSLPPMLGPRPHCPAALHVA